MPNDRMEIAPASDFDGIVTYSRVENRESDASRGDAPFFVGVKVPHVQAPGRDDAFADSAGKGTASRRRRYTVGLFSAAAAVAAAAGVGIIAGSFVFPTVGKVVPVMISDGSTATPDPAPDAKNTDTTAVAPAPTAAHTVVLDMTPGISPSAAGSRSVDVPPAAEPTPATAPALAPKPATADTPEVLASAPAAEPPVPRSRPAHGAASDGDSPAPAAATPAPVAKPAPAAEAPPPPVVIAPPAVSADGNDAVAEAQPLQPPVSEVDPLAPPATAVAPPQAEADTPIPPASIPQQPDYAAGPPIGDQSGQGDAVSRGADEASFADPRDEPYQSALDQWTVISVRHGRAIVDGRERGIFAVEEGAEIPGVGIVEAIERHGRRWAVVTSVGVIMSAPEIRKRPFWAFR